MLFIIYSHIVLNLSLHCEKNENKQTRGRVRPIFKNKFYISIAMIHCNNAVRLVKTSPVTFVSLSARFIQHSYPILKFVYCIGSWLLDGRCQTKKLAKFHQKLLKTAKVNFYFKIQVFLNSPKSQPIFGIILKEFFQPKKNKNRPIWSH